MRLKNNGDLEFCRWTDKINAVSRANIADTDVIQWFQQSISPIRQRLLDGDRLFECRSCYEMEKHGKISGRQKQLLKTGIKLDYFQKSLISSPWFAELQYSNDNQGHTDQWPQDWQIDLGNYCNSACIFCDPGSSSRLASEFKILGLITSMPPQAWCDNLHNLEKFIQILNSSPHLAYLHFIGGETLITPAFKTILSALIKQGLSKNITIGFTTNLTTWDQSVIDLLSQFHEVNLGMSIECINPLNDYLRYGGDLNNTLQILNQWLELAERLNWLVQLRITPTVFSIWHLDTVYEYAFQHQLSVESCNFLEHPADMRPSVLPVELREIVMGKLQSWVLGHEQITESLAVINTRDRNLARQQIVEDAKSYIHYLRTQPDESHRLPDLVRYVKLMEKNRGNSILDYLPEYETILRSAGY